MPKIIGFDMSRLQIDRNGKIDGLTTYTRQILEALCACGCKQHIVGIYFADMDFEELASTIIQKYREIISLAPINRLEDIEQIVEEYQIDIFYSSLPNLRKPDCYLLDCKRIFSIHGMRAVEMPLDRYEYKYRDSLKEYLIFLYKKFWTQKYVDDRIQIFKHFFERQGDSAKYIITTKHTQFTLMSLIPDIDLEQFKVWMPPLIYNKADMTVDISKEYHVDKKQFVLIIMANRWEKNAYRAIKAMDRLYEMHKEMNIKTLVAGMKPDMSSTVYKLKNQDKFSFAQYVPMGHLQTLYMNAFCLLFPSLNEGYGYPPLEAMKYGTPVITSGVSAIPEVCSNAVLYANPYSIIELGTRIYQLLYDSEMYEELQRKGHMIYKHIQEEYSTKKLLDLFFS